MSQRIQHIKIIANIKILGLTKVFRHFIKPKALINSTKSCHFYLRLVTLNIGINSSTKKGFTQQYLTVNQYQNLLILC